MEITAVLTPAEEGGFVALDPEEPPSPPADRLLSSRKPRP
jgi:hypothetical protein